MTNEVWIETREAKQCGNSAHILVPKRFRGDRFRLERIGDGDEVD
jgi:putative transposon-encoded protein